METNNQNMSKPYDIECALAAGGVAVGVNKILYSGTTEASLKDGAMMTASNLTAQVVSLGQMLPVPDTLSHIADAVATGITYAALNHFYPASPFSGNTIGTVVYGIVCDYLGEHAVLPAVHAATPL